MGPCLALSGVAEEIHDDGATSNGLINLKEVLARNPAVLDGIFP
jgi:hypothetical protein